jgi:hypothetical protein
VRETPPYHLLRKLHQLTAHVALGLFVHYRFETTLVEMLATLRGIIAQSIKNPSTQLLFTN